MTQPAYQEFLIHEGEGAIVRLAGMGVRVNHFDAAVRRGHDLSSRVSDVHPRTHKGQVMWAETVAELRTQLLDINQGWDIGQTDNYETVYNPERGIAIAVVGGDANCGERAFGQPKAARRRGPVTEKRIRRNVLGQQMFDLPEFKDPPRDDEQCDTWFLLLNARNNRMYLELSLATSLGSDSRFGLWKERIILPYISLEGVVVDPTEPDETEPPRVTVGRK
ncbi:hypothetical protein [Actinoplanes siamensis]|uniref:Uncharacterized protein n=1 Tax=Actinoplanes siamensis TaxID=1223317 RepID=A0A919NC76_9ACTN|nr:hypothetical protein [Actinoplanes siamensis]GIF08090.1 hypothetical protein Asi03nite_56280 [Actinoplanes siamensis]